MSSTFEAFGLDPNDPEVIAAKQDTQALFGLIEALVGARNGRDLTQSEVAEAMGVGQSTVSNFERLGGNPTIGTIQRYARAVGARVRFITSVNSEPGWIPVPLAGISVETTGGDADVVESDPGGRWRRLAKVG